MTTITANIKSGKTVVRTVKCDFPLPATVSDAVKTWGEKAVLGMVVDSATISIQGIMRRAGDPERKDGRLSDADVAKHATAWKPGTRTVNRDPAARVAKLAAAIGKLTKEQIAEVMRAAASTPAAVVKKGAVKK